MSGIRHIDLPRIAAAAENLGYVAPAHAQVIGATAMLGLREGHPLDVGVQWRHNIAEHYGEVLPFPGVEVYAARAIAASVPGDIVQLPPELEPHLPHLLEHYRRTGIQTATGFTFDLTPRPGPNSVFAYGGAEHAINPNERRLITTGELDDKDLFIERAIEQGWSVPPTVVRHGGEELGDVPFAGPYFVKGPSISGSGVTRCDTLGEVEAAVAVLRQGGRSYQVQQSVGEDFVFLNVQYNVVNGVAEFVATTEQVLSGFAHNGNKFPSPYDPRAFTDAPARYAAENGVEALLAFDVAINPSDPSEGYIIDPNIRPNGSSYSTAIAERLGITGWTCFNVPIDERLDLQSALGLLGDLEYDPRSGSGVIVANGGIVTMNKLGLLFAGSEAQRERLIAEVNARLGRK